METQIKSFKWAIGLIFTLCAAWGFGIYAQADSDGKSAAVFRQKVETNVDNIEENKSWLKETSDKTQLVSETLQGLKSDSQHMKDVLNDIKSILREVHKIQ